MSDAPMLSLEEAFRAVDEALAGRGLPSETVSARAAAGRVLARECRSLLDVPPFDKSAMDGYALPEGDAPGGVYRLAGMTAAGQAAAAPLRPGEAVKVMTGAPVPPGTVEVVMQEDTEEGEGTVRVLRRGPSNFCPRGEDLRRGDAILPAGRVLRAVDTANLVSCGIMEVEVARRPRAAILLTGDEIVDDPARLAPGRIMNSNGPLLAALCASRGLEAAEEVRVPDVLEELCGALEGAAARSDLVVLTGGVSVGQFDLVPAALDRLGLRIHFSRVALKPGRPMTFATGPGRIVFGLPGNPLSVFLMFHLLVLRAAARLTGSAPPLRAIRLPLAAAFRRGKRGRMEFVPARVNPRGRVEPIPFHGSAHLLAMTEADGFLSIPADAVELPAGGDVQFWPLPETRA